jgi:uncharacterized protein
MPKEVQEFQIFVKPVGPLCNLNCSYCYYVGKKDLYPGKNDPVMNDETLERFIIENIKSSDGNLINFSWHGGEPLLAGIDFFNKAVHLQRRHLPHGKTIINGIQTNGTLLNEEWCGFLADEKFVVGISLDGPGDMHNINRKTRSNETTLQKVIGGYELLKKHGVIAEILCVVNSGNVKYPLVVYNFFKELGAQYITFLPLVEKLSGADTGVSSNSVPALEFGYFLSAVFDEWVEKDIGEIKIQIFEEAARTAFNQDHTLCIFKVNCGGVPVVEHTGDFYSCDHYVSSGYLIGNVMAKPLASLIDSERQRAFGKAKSLTLPEYCIICEVRNMCNGECPKNRFISTPDGEPGLNYLCSGYKYFFSHCRPFVDAISAAWKNQIR